MVKIVKKFIDIEIKSIKFVEKEVNFFDGDGLLLWIVFLVKGGKKNWYFRYVVFVIKKWIKVSLGIYFYFIFAKVWALCDEYLLLFINGIDF